jgi:hypothetical protein
MVVAAAQHAADPVQRIMAAAAVPGEFLLDPPSHVVDRGEPEPGHVERVEHPHRLG